MNGVQQSFEDSFIQFGFPGGGEKPPIYIHFEDGRPTVIVERQVAIVVFTVCVGIINN